MYKRLSIEEREEIARGLAKGCQIPAIAIKLGRHRTTIYREIYRFTPKNHYSPTHAQTDAVTKQKGKRQGKTKITREQWEWIEKQLKKRWSPEEISNYLKKHPISPSFQISHESIYHYIYSQEEGKKKALITYLRHRKKKRKRRKPSLEKRGKIKHALSIHERPKEIEQRETFGHWEGDLIIGKDHKTAIGTLVERKSRFVKIVPLPKGKDSLTVVHSFVKALSHLPLELKKSMTYDRGLEMSLHQIFTTLTGTTVYFADPRAPWQRGTNENTNGLIRGFFPKTTDFSQYTEEDFQEVEDLLNDRPRKVIEFRTPREVFETAICH